jgi:S1-C subfamily serine protease
MVGDILVGLAGSPVSDPDSLASLLTGEVVGKPTAVEILRGGQPMVMNVTPGERKA